MQQALERARSGGGPTVIEALSYRLGDHTTADDASRYRDQAELDAAKECEPLIRLVAYLQTEYGWLEKDDQQLKENCLKKVDEAVERYLAAPKPTAAAIFDHMYDELPHDLKAQKTELVKEVMRNG